MGASSLLHDYRHTSKSPTNHKAAKRTWFPLDGFFLGGSPMARIPEHEIERLKREIALERLVAARGVQLKRHGARPLGLCPFHDDRTPVARDHARDEPLALPRGVPDGRQRDRLGDEGGGDELPPRGGAASRGQSLFSRLFPTSTRGSARDRCASTVPKLDAVEPSAEDDVLLRQVVDYYHATLKESPEALAYLERRGLDQRGDDRALQAGLRQPDAGLQVAGEEPQGRRRAAGAAATAGHHARERARALQRLARDPDLRRGGPRDGDVREEDHATSLRRGTPLHLYLPGPHRGVFNLEALASSEARSSCARR